MTTGRNVLSIDVEDWFQVENLHGIVPRERWESMPLRVERNLDCILGILDPLNIKATFFTLGWVAERLPRIVQRLAAEGHEVASHGWSHTPLWRLTPDQFRDEVIRSRRVLEDLSGQRVLGYRAPTFSITRDTLWGLSVLAESGYLYDSSIFPVRHDRYGIPEAPLAIHRREEGLWEVPMSVYQVGSYRLPVAGGGYFRLYPEWLTVRAIRAINAAGREAIVYLHPWEFDPEQPVAQGMKPLARFRHRVGLARTAGRLSRLLRQFPFGPARDVLSARGAALPSGA